MARIFNWICYALSAMSASMGEQHKTQSTDTKHWILLALLSAFLSFLQTCLECQKRLIYSFAIIFPKQCLLNTRSFGVILIFQSPKHNTFLCRLFVSFIEHSVREISIQNIFSDHLIINDKNIGLHGISLKGILCKTLPPH